MDKSIIICVMMIFLFKIISFIIFKTENPEEKAGVSKWNFSIYDSVYYATIILPILEFAKKQYSFNWYNIIIGIFFIIVGIIIMITAEFGIDAYKNVRHERNMKIYYYIRFPNSLSNLLFLIGISISLQSILGTLLVILFFIIELVKIKKIDKHYQENILGYKEYALKTKLLIPFLV